MLYILFLVIALQIQTYYNFFGMFDFASAKRVDRNHFAIEGIQQ